MVGRTKITSDTAALRVDHLEEQSTLTSQTAALGIDRRLDAAEIVHELLIDMIDPALQGKQAHWNLQRRIEDRQVVDRGVARLHAIAEVGRSRPGSLGELDLADGLFTHDYVNHYGQISDLARDPPVRASGGRWDRTVTRLGAPH